MKRRKLLNFCLSFIGPIVLIIILTMPIGPLAGGLGIIQPVGGIFDAGGVINEPKTQQIQLPGLKAEVEVIIDEWGIPHIYGASRNDVYRALGYMHAKDRLFQMVMQTYQAAGRISEVVGAFANSSDKFFRSIGLARAAEETWQWCLDNPDNNENVTKEVEIVQAYTVGVNAFISSMTAATRPLEFKLLGYTPDPWEPVNTFIWAKYMTWTLSGGIDDLLKWYVRTTINNDTMYNELYPEVMPYTIPIIPEQTNLTLSDFPNAPGGFPASPEPIIGLKHQICNDDTIPSEKLDELIFTISDYISPFIKDDIIGSNNWVAHGSKTSTGMPILCNDPHLSFYAPAIWYEIHLVIPGEMNVRGVSLPGTPGVLLGHNEHIAWGLTNVGADVLDIFVEETSDSQPGKYKYNDEWINFEVVNEDIHTKEGTIIPFEVSWTVHGPCVDSVIDDEGYGEPFLAMNWTGLGVTHEVLSLTMLNTAENIHDYHAAMYWWDSPPQNIVYADVQGNIAMTVAGRLPIRSGYNGHEPVPPPHNDSVGMVSNIPFAYNPRSVNPVQGYLQSANQRSIDPDMYGFEILGPFADGYRGRRIDTLLQYDNEITMDDMKRFQADSLEVRAQRIVPFVIDAWENVDDGNTTINEVVSWLEDWDYVMEADETAPTVWVYLRDALVYETFDELQGQGLLLPRTPVLERLLREGDEYYFDDVSTTTIIETHEDIIVKALYRAVDAIVDDPLFGSDMSNWIYGNKHRVYFDHLMGRSIAYVGGLPHRGQNTLNNAGGWTVKSGPSWRLVADMSDISNSEGIYPSGQSGNIFSPHWDDLFYIWYSYSEQLQQYGYHALHFYASANDFRNSGTTMERTIRFVP